MADGVSLALISTSNAPAPVAAEAVQTILCAHLAKDTPSGNLERTDNALCNAVSGYCSLKPEWSCMVESESQVSSSGVCAEI